MDERYQAAWRRSLEDPEGYWGEQAGALEWTRPFERVLDTGRPSGQWFVGGELNACHEALDRHVAAGRGEALALVYDSAMTGEIQRYSYAELTRRVAELAGWLAARGVTPGDRVLIYMPLVPEAVMAMLACARLGAVHVVVFGGFGAAELASRIEDTQPRLILTASCGLEPGRVIEYLPMLEQALGRITHRPDACLVLQREAHRARLDGRHQLDWQTSVTGSTPAACQAMPATAPLYVLHTSGTTGRPKGIVRDTGGHLVALRHSMSTVYDIQPGEVFWAASDIGWVVGHSYIVYGPLAHGCTTVLYEGKPVGTPDAAAFWRVAAEHRVNVMFTAPTAIRAVRREDPEAEKLAGHDLSALRTLFLAGERADPETLVWAQRKLGIPVIDHWWQTETGSAIAANCLGLAEMPVKPGSVSVPVPGFDVRILDDQGEPLPPGEQGAVALRLPLPPGCLAGLWNDDAGFARSYLERYPGHYFTGDGGVLDTDGYLHVLGRVDDVINVAGHRLSTGEIEQVLAAHRDIAECAVIAVPDALKGQLPLGLVVLKAGVARPAEDIAAELVAKVREDIGAIACFRRCLVVERLPKTRSGKILRGTMSRIAAGETPAVPATIEDPDALSAIRTRLNNVGEEV
ncbi:MAG: propionyl-CoA synthetase [Gammaproteobacteria bacterium]|nr:MAG: propionyl-CoA synthetase [Gammaproteobacteria bacterium]